MTTLGAIFSNPVWRAKNVITYIGEAQAPILWDYDQYGYVPDCYQKKSAAGNRYAGMREISCETPKNVSRSGENAGALRAGTDFKALRVSRQGFEIGCL